MVTGKSELGLGVVVGTVGRDAVGRNADRNSASKSELGLGEVFGEREGILLEGRVGKS